MHIIYYTIFRFHKPTSGIHAHYILTIFRFETHFKYPCTLYTTQYSGFKPTSSIHVLYILHNIQVLNPLQVSMYSIYYTIFRFQTHFKYPCTLYTTQYSGFKPTSGNHVLYILHNIQVSNPLQVTMYSIYFTIFRFQTHFRNIHVLYILHNIQVCTLN